MVVFHCPQKLGKVRSLVQGSGFLLGREWDKISYIAPYRQIGARKLENVLTITKKF